MPKLIYNKELEKLKQFKKDVEWFQNNYTKLKKSYKNQYAAIKDETLLDHDKDLNLLINRLKTKYEDTNSIVVEYINGKKEVYVL